MQAQGGYKTDNEMTSQRCPVAGPVSAKSTCIPLKTLCEV